MKKYFASIDSSQNSKSPSVGSSSNPNPPSVPNLSSCEAESDVDFDELPADPGLRKDIFEYVVNDREKVRQIYLQKGPCQPRNHDFPVTLFGSQRRRFVREWFNDYSDWLEYSKSKDAAFCLPCYLFKPNRGNQGGGDTFVGEGFRNWKKKDRFDVHVGDQNSAHNQCVRACQDLMRQQHRKVCLSNHSEQSQIDYRARLIASVDCIRFLLLQGWAFCDRDESNESSNEGKFLEILEFLADHSDEIKRVVLDSAHENVKLTSPRIQKTIINAIAVETTNAIIRDMGGDMFSVFVDEVCDISVEEEQMAVVLRFVDARGCVVERFLGIVHVGDTTALSLKMNVEALFSKHGLNISRLRGQGFDGASNMRDGFNDLKSLIMMENQSAYYVHCFAHQLQQTLVTVAESHPKVSKFFDVISMFKNIDGASCNGKYMFREESFEKVIEGLREGEKLFGRGHNQEVSLDRAGAARWESHYKMLVSLICLFDPTIEVLMAIVNDSKIPNQRAQADCLMERIQCFEFIFCLFLMKNILGVSNELSEALQRFDQDIVHAMNLVRITKQLLQQMRDGGWESLWEEAASFCIKRNIIVPNMEDLYVIQGRSRRHVKETTNLHLYRVELFYYVIDMQLQELNDCFNEVNTELLLCMSCLDPSDAFSAFDKRKLVRFAEFYPSDFSVFDIMALGHQLDCYIIDVRSNDHFANLAGMSELSKKLVQLKKHCVYPLVYLLVKLALLLPVAAATVERVCSAMKLVKRSLHNRLGDDLMNDCLIAYIEKDVVSLLEIEDIIDGSVQDFKS